MTAIPTNKVTYEDIAEWERLKTELNKIKAKEMLLRQKIYGGLFPNPVEGTNYYDLLNGYRMKAVAVITRDVDQAVWTASKEEFKKLKINADSLIKNEPHLITSVYRKLTDEQRAVVDNALIIKDGAPQLSIVAPKDAE